MTAPLPSGPRGNWLLSSPLEFPRDLLGFYERCARITLLPDPPVVPRPVVTLRPAHGIFATLRKRGLA